MSLVTDGMRTSTHSLSKKVGTGSRRQDFVGDSLINLRTSSSDTRLNVSKGGGGESEEISGGVEN